jgi:hypothetical protein
LLVTLLGIVAVELRRTAESSRRPARSSARAQFLPGLVGGTLTIGIACTVRAALRPPAQTWELVAGGLALLVGLVAVVGLPSLPAAPPPRPRTLLVAGVLLLALDAAILAAPGPAQRHRFLVFRIEGTCANHSCGLNAHSAPSVDAPVPARTATLRDGDAVEVVCQRAGGVVAARQRARSAIWDRLADGTWVSDLFLTTPGAGTFTRSIPRCAS